MKLQSVLLTCGIGAVLAPSHADACGFKVSGALGAVRYDNVNRTPNPIAVLMYRSPKSAGAKKVMTPTLERVLAKVGHHTKIVNSEADFRRFVKRGEWPCEVHKTHKVHAVVVDVEDTSIVGNLNGRTSPAVIPIVASPKQYDRGKRKDYPVILTPSARPSSHLPAIEKVARTLRKKGVGETLLASATDSKAATKTDDRQPIRTAGDDRAPVSSGGAAATGDRAAVKAGGGGTTTAGAPVATRTTEPEKKAPAVSEPKPEPKPEPVVEKKVAPPPAKTAEPVRKVEPAVEVARNVKKTAPVRDDTTAIAAPRTMQIEEKKKSVSPTPRQTEVYFRTASRALSGSARKRLYRHYKWLKANPQAKLRLEAHTDSIGPSEYNLALSTRRGEAVQKYFLDKGMDMDRVQVVPLGEEDPVHAPPTNPKNRCVVVKPAE